MPRAVAKDNTKRLGTVIPIRVPLDEDSKEIEIPIRLTLVVSLYRVKKISEEQETSSGELIPRLTPRQNQVLTGILEGKCNKDIANGMDLSVRTVKFHVTCLLNIFQVSARADLRTAVCGKVNLRRL